MTRIDLSTMELTGATPWTPEEELAEAKAWGYDSVGAWEKAMREAHEDTIKPFDLSA